MDYLGTLVGSITYFGFGIIDLRQDVSISMDMIDSCPNPGVIYPAFRYQWQNI